MGSVWLARRSDGRFEGQGGRQAPQCEPGRARGRGAIPAGGEHPGSTPASAHRASLRRGRVAGGAAVPGARARRRRADRPLLRREGSRRGGAPACVPGRPGGCRPRARKPDRAPGHQALQRPRRRGRAGEAARLRDREAARGGGRDGRGDGVDARGRAGADARIRGSGAGDGGRDHDGHGRLCAGDAALRASDRAASGASGRSSRRRSSSWPSWRRSRSASPTRPSTRRRGRRRHSINARLSGRRRPRDCAARSRETSRRSSRRR